MQTKFIWVVSWLVFFVSCSAPGTRSNDEVLKQVRGVLQDQVESWNQGDLNRFMETYWKSSQLTFFSGDNELAGWQQTMDRYQRRYGSGAEMGDLEFEDLAVEMLGESSAFVRGRYRLQRNGELTGIFTVVLRRLPQGWRIVHDHTSTACASE